MNTLSKYVAGLHKNDCIFFCGQPAQVLSEPELDGEWCRLTLATSTHVITGWQPAWVAVETWQ